MAYQENPNFPNNPVDPLPVNNSQVRNLDNQKIIDRLEAIENKLTAIESDVNNIPGTQGPNLLPFVEEFNLPTGITNLGGVQASFFSIDNQQEGDTGEISILLQTQNGAKTINVKPGVIYNSPQFAGFFYNIFEVDNSGADSKKIILYKTF
jgi:hypothetical protein